VFALGEAGGDLIGRGENLGEEDRLQRAVPCKPGLEWNFRAEPEPGAGGWIKGRNDPGAEPVTAVNEGCSAFAEETCLSIPNANCSHASAVCNNHDRAVWSTESFHIFRQLFACSQQSCTLGNGDCRTLSFGGVTGAGLTTHIKPLKK
jgi:hypothetical protein